MPIIELEKLRASIVKTQDLLDLNGIPKYLDDSVCSTTNCYTYALGILYNGPKNFPLNPGFTEGIPYWGRNTDEFLNGIYTDLKNLNISFRKIELNEDIKLEKNEYLIKLFFTPANEMHPKGDFHFVRQEPKRGYWFHKEGLEFQPQIIHSPSYPLILFDPYEPDEISCVAIEDFHYTLEPVIYLAIKEPRKSHRKFKKTARH